MGKRVIQVVGIPDTDDGYHKLVTLNGNATKKDIKKAVKSMAYDFPYYSVQVYKAELSKTGKRRKPDKP